MQDWRQRIFQGLRESRLLLACLSPAYLKSEYCEWEFVEYLKYEIGHLHGFNGVAPIYFVEMPGLEEKKNANLQFERVRRELKKLTDACEPHRCLPNLRSAGQDRSQV